MLRRLLVVGFIAAAIAACGSGGSSPSTAPSSSDTASAMTSTTPSIAPSVAASVMPSAAAVGTRTVACDLVGVRKQPTTKGAVEGRIHAGSIVRVVDTVPGDVYSAGACGTGGTEWLKIDEVDGKTAKSVYGVDFVYAAAGYFR